MAAIIDEFGPDAGLVPFVVDTGAARTTIHALDAMRYFGKTPADLDSSTWATTLAMGGIGGSMQCKESATTFGMRHEDGTIETISGQILIGDIKSAGVPSLLGWDLLKFFRLEVHGGDLTIALHRL
jgi:hypothetical protein